QDLRAKHRRTNDSVGNRMLTAQLSDNSQLTREDRGTPGTGQLIRDNSFYQSVEQCRTGKVVGDDVASFEKHRGSRKVGPGVGTRQIRSALEPETGQRSLPGDHTVFVLFADCEECSRSGNRERHQLNALI